MPQANAALSDINIDLDEATAYGPACAKSEDDSGMGGTHVHCYYACFMGNVLVINGQADDPDADMSGSTSCGGTYAICRGVGPECKGVSEGATTDAESKAKCSGASDEFWDSTATIACSSQGGDPEGLICRVAPDLCNKVPDLPLPGTEQLARFLLAVCKAAAASGSNGFVVASYTSAAYSAATLVDGVCVSSAGQF